MTEDRTTYKPKLGEGQVTINTPWNKIPHGHPTKMQKHIDRFKEMTRRIDQCIGRVIEDRPYQTIIKLSDDEWLIKNIPGRLI